MAEEQHSQASQKEEALLQGTKSWPQVRGARGLGQSLRQALVIKCLWASSFPSGSDGKESACEAGDQVRSLGQEDPLEDAHWALPGSKCFCCCSAMSDSFQPRGLQHARPPCPSPTPTVHSDSVMPSSHLILCRPLLLLPPIPPSIRAFSKESALRMRWPKYWSFSFSITPSNIVNHKSCCLVAGFRLTLQPFGL